MLLCACSVQAAELPRNVAQVVVLRNGNILQGIVRHVNERLVISDGGQRITRVPLDDVDFVCADLEAAYRRKLSRLQAGNVEQHLRLAHWCLRYELVNAAADRLLYLTRIAPQNAAVRALENRMRKIASDRTATRSQPEITKPQPPDAQSLEGLPAEALPRFTRVVQPLILNRCGQTTCHGSATTSGFSVTHGMNGIPNRELTWRNLAAVLQHVQNQPFSESPLLLKARSIHGSSTMSPIGVHETRQFQHLYDWVRLVTVGNGSENGANKLEAQGLSEDGLDFARVNSHLRQSNGPAANALERLYQDSGPRPPARKPSDSAGAKSDPFDPSRFNAQQPDNR